MSNKGLSNAAVQVEDYDSSRKKWTRKKKRPLKYRNKTYGLVVHTTGSGITSKALRKKRDVTELCLDRYLKTGGATYLNTYDGTLIQMANDFELAYGASVTEQLKQHPWDVKLSEVAALEWEDRWEHLEDVDGPLSLFPTEFANSCYVHVEMPPCFGYGKISKKLEPLATPMGYRLWFTEEQHLSVVKLAIDLADRNNWPDGWWRTGRLVGHEDISPVTRDRDGGWDPGALRDYPRFSWEFVYAKIEEEYSKRARDKEVLEVAEKEVKNEQKPDFYGDLVESFVSFIYGLFGRR